MCFRAEGKVLEEIGNLNCRGKGTGLHLIFSWYNDAE